MGRISHRYRNYQNAKRKAITLMQPVDHVFISSINHQNAKGFHLHQVYNMPHHRTARLSWNTLDSVCKHHQNKKRTIKLVYLRPNVIFIQCILSIMKCSLQCIGTFLSVSRYVVMPIRDCQKLNSWVPLLDSLTRKKCLCSS